MTTWVAPVGEQLRFLVDWLEPVLSRRGLTPVPAEQLHIVVGESDEAPPAFEPFDALVGPVRMEPEGVVADVIPVEAFAALIGQDAAPRVFFAYADGSLEHEPLEFVASEAVIVAEVVRA